VSLSGLISSVVAIPASKLTGGSSGSLAEWRDEDQRGPAAFAPEVNAGTSVGQPCSFPQGTRTGELDHADGPDGTEARRRASCGAGTVTAPAFRHQLFGVLAYRAREATLRPAGRVAIAGSSGGPASPLGSRRGPQLGWRLTGASPATAPWRRVGRPAPATGVAQGRPIPGPTLEEVMGHRTVAIEPCGGRDHGPGWRGPPLAMRGLRLRLRCQS